MTIHCAQIMVKNANGRTSGFLGGVFAVAFAGFSVQYKNSWTVLPYVGNDISSRGVLMLGVG